MRNETYFLFWEGTMGSYTTIWIYTHLASNGIIESIVIWNKSANNKRQKSLLVPLLTISILSIYIRNLHTNIFSVLEHEDQFFLDV